MPRGIRSENPSPTTCKSSRFESLRSCLVWLYMCNRARKRHSSLVFWFCFLPSINYLASATMSLYELFFGFSDQTKARHPHVFKDLDIDRRKCHRVVPMKVLCLSMGRTGTASMKVALEILGYPTSHGFDMHENPNDADLWMEAIDGKVGSDSQVVYHHPRC